MMATTEEYLQAWRKDNQEKQALRDRIAELEAFRLGAIQSIIAYDEDRHKDLARIRELEARLESEEAHYCRLVEQAKLNNKCVDI